MASRKASRPKAQEGRVGESMFILRLVRWGDLFSLLNAACGMLAIMLSIGRRLDIAVGLLLAAVFFDAIDGKVARWTGPGVLGKHLDSLADMVSFGVAPAIFAYSLYPIGIAPVIYVIFVMAGALRLARFNAAGGGGAFAGMPITANGIIVPFLYVVGFDAHLLPFFFVILSFLMVAHFRLKKIV
ncbi:MAG: CDP-diacylglycerol--serine O-phosphatidyltransferase [archaeon]